MVGWYNPTNGQVFMDPTNVYIHASVTDSNVIRTMQYFAGSNSLVILTNTGTALFTNTSTGNPFGYLWTNPPAGTYILTAVATDSAGNTATSGPVTITVNSPPPPPPVQFTIRFYYPTNGQSFTTPTNIPLYAFVTDSNIVQTVQFFAGTNSVGTVTNKPGAPPTTTSTAFEVLWSNVPPGSYSLTAVATDSAGATATSGPVNITVHGPPPPPPIPFVVGWYYPTNGQVFTDPTNVYIHASVTDSNVVRTMQYFAGTNSLAIVTNTGTTLFTNTSNGNPFAYFWTNPPPGNYTLTAVATDSAGNTATSGPVTITVNPAPPVPFAVRFYYPTMGQSFTAPTNIPLYALVTDSNVVQTVQFFAGSNSVGIATNKPGAPLTSASTAFEVIWSNVPPGNYILTAVATDSAGATATSGSVSITVKSGPPPVPFAVGWLYPTNGQTFTGPTNIGLHAWVTDSNVVQTMQYFSGGTNIGTVTNTNHVMFTSKTAGNPFFFLWSNVPPGSYTLTAVATDSTGATATSGPITINVISNQPAPPIVTIYGPDPVAFIGTNSSIGTNTATLLVRRDSGTNASLTVYYTIGGTASNGVDYVTIPNNITLAPGERYGLITIEPLADPTVTNHYETVTLALTLPPGSSNSTPPLAYKIGSPSSAGAVIVEESVLPVTKPLIHPFVDSSIHVSLPASNGLNYCLQYSTNFVTWTTICTNTVTKGSAHFVDPSGFIAPGAAYRIIPAAGPAQY